MLGAFIRSQNTSQFMGLYVGPRVYEGLGFASKKLLFVHLSGSSLQPNLRNGQGKGYGSA